MLFAQKQPMAFVRELVATKSINCSFFSKGCRFQASNLKWHLKFHQSFEH